MCSLEINYFVRKKKDDKDEKDDRLFLRVSSRNKTT
jgi:hypothetical protein